jgi:hypothetical protein
MAKAKSSRLEFGHWTPGWSGVITISLIHQTGLSAQYVEHPLRIGFPVGGAVNVAADF